MSDEMPFNVRVPYLCAKIERIAKARNKYAKPGTERKGMEDVANSLLPAGWQYKVMRNRAGRPFIIITGIKKERGDG